LIWRPRVDSIIQRYKPSSSFFLMKIKSVVNFCRFSRSRVSKHVKIYCGGQSSVKSHDRKQISHQKLNAEIQMVEFLLLVFTLLQLQVFKAADSFLRKSEKSFDGPLHSFSIIIHHHSFIIKF
jgi:hypothetical protein